MASRIRIWMVCIGMVAGLSVLSMAQPSSSTYDANAQEATSAPALNAQKGGEDLTGPYEVDPDWPRPDLFPDGLTWGRTSSVWAETPDRIFVIQSGLVPLSWRELDGERLIGAQQATGMNMPFLRQINNAVHCGTPMQWGLDPTQWHCEKRPDGTLIDKLVEQRTGIPIEGARWEYCLVVLNREGEIVDTWQQYNHLFGHPHTVMINPYDPERHVWVVDAGSQQVYKFTNDGSELVMTLGENRVPSEERTGSKTHFGNPTGIAFTSNGDFYVSDGYRNARVVRFSEDGEYLSEFGRRGDGPGELNLVHSIAAYQDRIYIADRANSRIQVFDLDGQFIELWPDITFPLFIAVSEDEHLWVSDGRTNKMLKYTLDGELVYSWGTFGTLPGNIWGVHNFNTDSEGNLYTAEVFGGRVQKFRPKPGANPMHLMGQLVSPGME